jgi:predicted O-methyltransferase YrrM
MTKRTAGIEDQLYDYITRTFLREPEVMARLRAETAQLGDIARMQIAPEQGQLMAFLIELIGARRVLEVGTFTGYSALAMARALPADGRLVACDISEEWTAIAQRYWREAGVAEKIDLRIGRAAETLAFLVARGEAGTYDAIFLDADKTSYDRYYELGLQLLRPAGFIMIDNAYRGARAEFGDARDPDSVAVQAFNAKLHGDERVSIALVPIADGLTLVRKR